MPTQNSFTPGTINGWAIARQYLGNGLKAFNEGEMDSAVYELEYALKYMRQAKAAGTPPPRPDPPVVKRCHNCGVTVTVPAHVDRHGKQVEGTKQVVMCGTLVPVAP